MVFIATANDRAELAALEPFSEDEDVAVLTVPPNRDSYAKKINYGFAHTTEPFVFTAADDLDFQPGWAEYALAAHLETGACVVGVNDNANAQVKAGHHATHFLVCRAYTECGTADEPESGKFFSEVYAHNFCDNEALATAMWRETYAFAPSSVVQHYHPVYGTAPTDSTYEKGKASFAQDRVRFTQRQKLWRN